jgi:EAL domain-containing protein (putative c-di-GMP-specific phosphodiesterase class I)
LAATRQGNRRGLSVIAVNLRPLEVGLELQLVRDAIVARLERWCQKTQATLYNVESRALFVVPKQREDQILGASSDVRTTVGYLVGPRQHAMNVPIEDLVQVFHTGRDVKAISTFLSTYVQVPKIFETPIAKGGVLGETHLSHLRRRVERGGAQVFIEEFGRNQPLAKLNDDAEPQAIGAERFVAVQHLRGMLLPGVTFEQGNLDFDRLAPVLDWAVLNDIRRTGVTAFGHVTVNLSAETFLSDAFAAYAREFAENTAGVELWAEIPIQYALANLGQFRRRQRELRDYRVFTMADHVQPRMLERMEVTDLDFDGFKFPVAETDTSLESIEPAVERLHERNAATIVTRVDHRQKLYAAYHLGVRHVQGYLIDRMLAQLDDPAAPV